MYKPIDMDSLKLNNNFKWVVTKDNFFTKEECEYIIEKADKYSERKKTKYFEQEDSICLLNIKKTNEQKYLNKFWEAISIANQVHYNYDIRVFTEIGYNVIDMMWGIGIIHTQIFIQSTNIVH